MNVQIGLLSSFSSYMSQQKQTGKRKDPDGDVDDDDTIATFPVPVGNWGETETSSSTYSSSAKKPRYRDGSRLNYKCTICGQPKKNHMCPGVEIPLSKAIQTEDEPVTLDDVKEENILSCKPLDEDEGDGEKGQSSSSDEEKKPKAKNEEKEESSKVDK